MAQGTDSSDLTGAMASSQEAAPATVGQTSGVSSRAGEDGWSSKVDIHLNRCACQAMAGQDVPGIRTGDLPPTLAVESSYGADDMTCAICLEQIQLENTAYVKGCEHAYCGAISLAVAIGINSSLRSTFLSRDTSTPAILLLLLPSMLRNSTVCLGGHTDKPCTVLQPSASCNGLSCARTAAAHSARSLSVAC